MEINNFEQLEEQAIISDSQAYEESLTNEVVPLSVYEVLLDYVDNKLLFEGKSIKEWKQVLILPSIPDYIDNSEIIKLNQRAVQLTEIVYTNLSVAKSRNNIAKAAFNKKVNIFKEELRSYKVDGKKLALDAIETTANNKAQSENTALTISEIFFDFWKYQVEKIKDFNTRLTSLNITVNQESKYLNQAQNNIS